MNYLNEESLSKKNETNFVQINYFELVNITLNELSNVCIFMYIILLFHYYT